ncbi:MAG TPA: DNA alkylation repair protein [Actinomycetota bacterium]|jgi:3-methyladenine DNA glycosylase AlkD|nr:DNA alkylation repair protein [Actinomycetota bacterium]
MDAVAAVSELRRRADPSRRPGMSRVGIDVSRALGVSIPDVRAIAKRCGTDHELAIELWSTGIHEARILATLVADRGRVDGALMELWVGDLSSWDVCDFAADLFSASPAGTKKIQEWARRPEGFVRRCAFSMIARRAVWAKDAPDGEFIGYLPLIRRGADDGRNEVKKGVSWALRQIGKRNRALHAAAVAEAEQILELRARPARWIARDALRELESEKTRSRLPG